MSSGGLSRTRLARFHDVMARFVERGEVPGLVALVSRRGETHVEALGMKALGSSDSGPRPTRRSTTEPAFLIPKPRVIDSVL
jgi:hypothetical protein